MEIDVIRHEFQPKSTISDFVINGNLMSNCLEDFDRMLNQSDPLNVILQKKVQNETAIPAGRYKVVIDYSDHFQKDMPHVLDVPGYEGIRIHRGNTDVDTEGCLLLGLWGGGSDFINHSEEELTYSWISSHALKIARKIFLSISKGR